jgi:hypothetical protein
VDFLEYRVVLDYVPNIFTDLMVQHWYHGIYQIQPTMQTKYTADGKPDTEPIIMEQPLIVVHAMLFQFAERMGDVTFATTAFDYIQELLLKDVTAKDFVRLVNIAYNTTTLYPDERLRNLLATYGAIRHHDFVGDTAYLDITRVAPDYGLRLFQAQRERALATSVGSVNGNLYTLAIRPKE